MLYSKSQIDVAFIGHDEEMNEGGKADLDQFKSEEGTCFFGLFQTVKHQLVSNDSSEIVYTRTEIKSVEISISQKPKFFKSFVISLFFLILIMVAECFYKQPFIDFTLSDDGIKYQ